MGLIINFHGSRWSTESFEIYVSSLLHDYNLIWVKLEHRYSFFKEENDTITNTIRIISVPVVYIKCLEQVKEEDDQFKESKNTPSKPQADVPSEITKKIQELI